MALFIPGMYVVDGFGTLFKFVQYTDDDDMVEVAYLRTDLANIWVNKRWIRYFWIQPDNDLTAYERYEIRNVSKITVKDFTEIEGILFIRDEYGITYSSERYIFEPR